MYQTAVIADDFTSATDCTIPFACRGLSTAALLSVPGDHFPDAQVLGVNTDSRVMEKREAYESNRAAALAVKKAGARLVYKSIDSTMRGNIGAEIDAVMDALELPAAIVAPAFPHYGRTTVGGVHYLNGKRLEETYLAKDPAWPAKESEIGKILGRQSARTVGCVGLDKVRGGFPLFSAAVKALREKGCTLIVADASEEDDLERIASHAIALGDCLIVGSTGLARHIASQLRKGPEQNQPFDKTERPVTVLAASVSPVTAGQAEELCGEPGTGRCLVSPCDAAFGSMEPYREKAEKILREGRDLVVQIDSSPEARERSKEEGVRYGVSQGETAVRITKAFSTLAGELLSKELTDAVILTGGDMARAMLSEIGGSGMELFGEVEPGIPMGRVIGERQFLAVTKAGAFGTVTALSTARRLLKKEPAAG